MIVKRTTSVAFVAVLAVGAATMLDAQVRRAGPPGSGALAVPDYPCGMTHLSTCAARRCHDCGDAPACGCMDASGGACDPVSRDYCDGSCTSGTCNESTTACGCLRPEGTAPPTKTQPGGPKSQRLQPVDPPQ